MGWIVVLAVIVLFVVLSISAGYRYLTEYRNEYCRTVSTADDHSLFEFDLSGRPTIVCEHDNPLDLGFRDQLRLLF